MTEHNHDDISLIIDHALSSYIPEDEPLGLQQRVLGRIRESIHSRQQRKLQLFIFAFASLCVALIALVVNPGSQSLRSRPAAQPPAPPVLITADRHERKAALPATVRRRFPVASPKSEHRHSLPKLDQFPAPAPMTNEERALLQLSAGSAVYLSASKHSSSIDPIQIEPLRINPL